ncbi:hypothetical protein AMJ80_06535 [bacterium SM23_31]|nr:MAG: hypothetical protein AMJ80_06535 [bacterium SM23_31]
MSFSEDIRDSRKTFLMIAGEPSGDIHGAGFIHALKEKLPGCSVFGIGGDMMKKEGMEVLFPVDKMAVLGIAEVIKHLPFIRVVFKTLINEVRERKPAAVILIDYPDFNIRFARKIRKHISSGAKIFCYISPQVWAWRKGRIKTITRSVDAMAVVLPFEEELYKKTGMRVQYVGHPLVDVLKPSSAKNEFFKKLRLDPNRPTIGLLPGSREQEIVRHLPVMLEAMHKVYKFIEDIQVIIGRAWNVPDIVPDSLFRMLDFKTVKSGDIYNIMHYSTLVVVSSGTATLETALAGTPMVIIYKMSPITYRIARFMVSMPYIGMANIVHGKKVVPELIQNDVKSGKIAGVVVQLLSDKTLYSQIKNKLRRTRNLLGKPGAAGRAVDLLLEILD